MIASMDDRPARDSSAGEALFAQVAREPRLSDKVAEMMLDTILSRRLQVGDRVIDGSVRTGLDKLATALRA